MKVAYHPVYMYPLPEGHRFPMEKYGLLREQLLYEGTLNIDAFFQPDALSEDILLLTHTCEYLDKLFSQTLSAKEIRRIGFPMTSALVQRGRHIANGTLQCALFAKHDGIALNIAGGTHHSFADRGEGFCIFNDIAIASNYLLANDLVKQILIVDLDVHQGNGTAHIFMNEPRVFTFSMHGEKNYPLQKEVSSLDIPLKDGIQDEQYLSMLDQILAPLFDQVEPDIVFYLSGVDVLSSDRLGRLSLSNIGCMQRDQKVLELCKRHAVPVVVSMGGGYSWHIRDIIEAHANTYRVAKRLFQ